MYFRGVYREGTVLLSTPLKVYFEKLGISREKFLFYRDTKIFGNFSRFISRNVVDLCVLRNIIISRNEYYLVKFRHFAKVKKKCKY